MNPLMEARVIFLLKLLTLVINSRGDYNVYANIVPNFMSSYFIFTVSRWWYFHFQETEAQRG